MKFTQKADTTGCAHSLDGPTRVEDGWEMGLCGNCHNQIAFKLDKTGKRTAETRLIVFWNFAIIGYDSRGPRYLGFTEVYEDAVKVRENMVGMGWKRVDVLDAGLSKITEKR